jgi:hypothetical protein
VAQLYYTDQLHEYCLLKQFFHLIKLPQESANMSSLCSFSDIILHMSVCDHGKLLPWMVGPTAPTLSYLCLLLPLAMFYVNQPNVAVSSVCYHHQELCGQNSYIIGEGVQFTGLRPTDFVYNCTDP